jgi:hypothetical protein
MGNASSAADNSERNADGREVLASLASSIELAGPRLPRARERELAVEYQDRVAPKWTLPPTDHGLGSASPPAPKAKPGSHLVAERPGGLKSRVRYRVGKSLASWLPLIVFKSDRPAFCGVTKTPPVT